MAFRFALFLLGFVSIVGAEPEESAEPLRLERMYTEGSVHCTFPGGIGLRWEAERAGGDVFFPDGELLGRFTTEEGAIVTVSFDASRIYPKAEQDAFFAVATDRMQGGSGRHAVFPHSERDWVVQVFVSPSEHIVSAQTFVADRPLALVFWLDGSEADPMRNPLVEAVLSEVRLEWRNVGKIEAE